MKFKISRPSASAVDLSSVDPSSAALSDDAEVTFDPASYEAVEAALGYSFTDKHWMELALTHRSIQSKGGKNDYERLEFLGDAVLDLAVAHLLLDQYPEAKEGELSKMRAALVNTASLAEVAIRRRGRSRRATECRPCRQRRSRRPLYP